MPLWRGLVGCVVAYALVLNALLSGVLGAEWTAKAAAGMLDLHCLTESGVAPPASEQAPTGHHDESSHCTFCTVAVAPAVLPADLSLATIVQYRAGAPAGVSDRDRPYLPVYLSRLPRGPPERS
jgi:hypothetical protein